MKRILLVLALAFGTSTFAQIEVTETVKPETIYLQAMGFHGLYKTKLNDSTYVYSMTFRDSQYQQISSYETIYFETIDDMKQFFNIVLSVLERSILTVPSLVYAEDQLESSSPPPDFSIYNLIELPLLK